MSIISIDGVSVKAPTSYNGSYEPISDGDRLLDSGDMVIRGIAGKAKFQYEYKNTLTTDLGPILKLWTDFKSTKNMIHNIEVYEPQGVRTYKVYFSPINWTLVKRGKTSAQDRWDVSFNLVEV